jgi:hypothetical protein
MSNPVVPQSAAVQRLATQRIGRRQVVAAATGGALLTALNAPLAFAHPEAATVSRFGKELNYGDGIIRMYARVQNGKTSSLGLFLSDGVLEGLPAHVDMSAVDPIVPMVPGINDIAIQHVTVGYNPHGHEPDGIFTLPHFDFHFYLITNAERMMIDPSRGAAFEAEANAIVSPDRMPSAFVPAIPPGAPFVAGTAPFMGLHWVDLYRSSATQPSIPFEHEFINGTYNGEWIFLEPMITNAWLASKASHSEPIKQPQTYVRPGSYPTHLNVFHSDEFGGWIIALKEFMNPA